MNRHLIPRGVRIVPLKNMGKSMLVYMYRPDRLREDLRSGFSLGYPPEDVDGFIKNGATGAKCIGVWKVYGNVETAQRKFSQYRKCTQLYCEAFQKHRSFDRLIVGCS